MNKKIHRLIKKAEKIQVQLESILLELKTEIERARALNRSEAPKKIKKKEVGKQIKKAAKKARARKMAEDALKSEA